MKTHHPRQPHHVHLEEGIPRRLVDDAGVLERSAVGLVVTLLEGADGLGGLAAVGAVDLARVTVRPVADVRDPLEDELVVAHHVLRHAQLRPLVLLAHHHGPHVVGALLRQFEVVGVVAAAIGVSEAHDLLPRVLLRVEVAGTQDHQRGQVSSRFRVDDIHRVPVGHHHGAVVVEVQVFHLDHGDLVAMDHDAMVLPRRQREWRKLVPG